MKNSAQKNRSKADSERVQESKSKREGKMNSLTEQELIEAWAEGLFTDQELLIRLRELRLK